MKFYKCVHIEWIQEIHSWTHFPYIICEILEIIQHIETNV
jgi:hypothetical protein